MSKIRILQVTGSLTVGGLQTVAMNCFRYIDRNKYAFDFLVYGDKIGEYETEVESLGGHVIHIPAPGKHYFQFYRNLIKVMREEGPYDIVHSHTFFNSGVVLLAAKKCGVKKCIAHSHSGERKSSDQIPMVIYNHVMRRILIKNADVYCACSEHAGNFLFGKEAFSSSKGMVLDNLIDFQKFRFSDLSRNQIRRELNILETEKVIGVVGHLEPIKNLAFLLRIFSELLKISNNYRLLIVGDGTLKDDLQKEAQQLYISNKIIWTGTRIDIPQLLSAMDLYSQPSLHEGFGIALREAQANGLPCVVGKNIISPEVWITKNHIELDFSDVNGWCQAFLTLERNNSESINANMFSNKYFKSSLEKLYYV